MSTATKTPHVNGKSPNGKPSRLPKPADALPENLEEVSQVLRHLGEEQRRLMFLEAKQEKEIGDVKRKYAEQITKHQAKVNEVAGTLKSLPASIAACYWWATVKRLKCRLAAFHGVWRLSASK